jgi:hypothetical protein
MGNHPARVCNRGPTCVCSKLAKWNCRIEAAPTSTPQRMDDKWSGNNLLLGSSSLANHGGYLSSFFPLPSYLLITTLQAGC